MFSQLVTECAMFFIIGNFIERMQTKVSLIKTYTSMWFLLCLSRNEINSSVWNARLVYSKHAMCYTERQKFIKLLSFKEQ